MMKEIDPNLQQMLDIGCQDLKDSDDFVIIIVGAEGAGKSVLSQQIAGYISEQVNTTFTVDNIHFNTADYQDFALSKPRYTINLLDESRSSLNKMRGLSKSNVTFTNYVSECRDSNQVHILLLPAFTDLDRYVAVHRSKLVINVIKYRDKETGKLIRGNYQIIKADNKYLLNKAWEMKYKGFPANLIWKIGKFGNWSPIDEKLYKEKKANHRKEKYSSENQEKPNKKSYDKMKKQLDSVKSFLKDNLGYKDSEIKHILKE